MSLRIIAGRWRGRALVAPPGDTVRPTSARAREALFSMLASRVGSFEGLRVADLFAGSGALGLEALSRGAAQACFVEQFPAPLAALRANIAALGVTGSTDVIAVDAAKLPRAPAPCHLILLDPPYHMGLAAAALGRLGPAGWVEPGTWISVETARDEELPDWEPEVDRIHGKARLRLFRLS